MRLTAVLRLTTTTISENNSQCISTCHVLAEKSKGADVDVQEYFARLLSLQKLMSCFPFVILYSIMAPLPPPVGSSRSRSITCKYQAKEVPGRPYTTRSQTRRDDDSK